MSLHAKNSLTSIANMEPLHIDFDAQRENIPKDYFENLSRKYPDIETLHMRWRFENFHGFNGPLIKFHHMKKLELIFMDNVYVRTAPPPFFCENLESLEINFGHRLSREWILFIVRHKKLKSLEYCPEDGQIINDEGILELASISSFVNGFSFRTFGDDLTIDGVKKFVQTTVNLNKIELNFDRSSADRFCDLEIPGWNIQFFSGDLIIMKV